MNRRNNWTGALLLPCVLVLAPGCASSGQKPFPSADAAAQSLVDALRDNERSRVKDILGPEGDQILSSGDKVADRAEVAEFLSQYDERHRIQIEPNGVNTLLVGEEEWPFPVPIVKSKGGYVFDTETGREEILNRRIGRNELSTQQVCLAIVDAQRDYVALGRSAGDLPEYAQKVISDPGQRNGLYWPTAEGEEPSPLGPLAAAATAQGYRGPGGQKPQPYHGYYYRLLTAQGPHAKGGAMDYVVNGRLIGGFGVVAYPAMYGNSGIMTFITNHDGVVYQRDLGQDTREVAEGMKVFDPGAKWTQATDGSVANTSQLTRHD